MQIDQINMGNSYNHEVQRSISIYTGTNANLNWTIPSKNVLLEAVSWPNILQKKKEKVHFMQYQVMLRISSYY